MGLSDSKEKHGAESDILSGILGFRTVVVTEAVGSLSLRVSIVFDENDTKYFVYDKTCLYHTQID